IAVVERGLGDAYVNQHIALVRLRPDINPKWVAYALCSHLGRRQFESLNDAGAKSGLNLGAVGALRIPVPDRQIQDRAVSALDAIESSIAVHRAGLKKLQSLREGLVEDLLTGKVRANDPDIVIPLWR